MGRWGFVVHHHSSDNILAVSCTCPFLCVLPMCHRKYRGCFCFPAYTMSSFASMSQYILFPLPRVPSSFLPISQAFFMMQRKCHGLQEAVPDTLIWLRCSSQALPDHSELHSLLPSGWNVVDYISLSPTHQVLRFVGTETFYSSLSASSFCWYVESLNKYWLEKWTNEWMNEWNWQQLTI